MADDLSFGDFTLGEQARITALVARMGKRGLAGEDVDIRDLQRKVERIEDQARRRKNSQ
ncbi:DUF6257 family protein [Streptomyces luteogriseus]|uniref:DUF6257 family protein n=1 Tax=Streptomyces luteogriseus TaxID=68233 RepID=UPI003791B715